MSVNTTKEGIEVKPGQVWRDLDQRMNGRTVTVLAVADGYASVTGNTRLLKADGTHYKTRLAVRRMHKTSTGWALVSEAP